MLSLDLFIFSTESSTIPAYITVLCYPHWISRIRLRRKPVDWCAVHSLQASTSNTTHLRIGCRPGPPNLCGSTVPMFPPKHFTVLIPWPVQSIPLRTCRNKYAIVSFNRCLKPEGGLKGRYWQISLNFQLGPGVSSCPPEGTSLGISRRKRGIERG